MIGGKSSLTSAFRVRKRCIFVSLDAPHLPISLFWVPDRRSLNRGHASGTLSGCCEAAAQTRFPPLRGEKRRRLAPPAGYTDILQHVRPTMDKDEYLAKVLRARGEIERLDGVLKSVSMDMKHHRHRFAHATVELAVQHLEACKHLIAELAGLKETVVL